MVGPSRQRKRPSPILLVKSEKPIPKAPQTRSVKEASTNPSLLTYNEIPEWYQDNECIVYGYRPPTNSTAKCFASWVYIHNETFNIFSHLLPAILSVVCAGVMPSYFFNQYPVATTGDQLVFGFFLLSVVVCLSLSSTYHTLMNHSASVSKTWLRLDYVGIMILTLGDFISGIYLVFYCEPTLQRVYWTMISTLCTTTALILVRPKFQGPRFRTLRVMTFVSTGLSGFAPLIHGTRLFGIAQMNKQSGMPYYLGEGLLLVLGALLYTTRLPESVKPGRFDIWGCSHQIFHVLVVAATSMHAYGISQAFDYNYREKRCIP